MSRIQCTDNYPHESRAWFFDDAQRGEFRWLLNFNGDMVTILYLSFTAEDFEMFARKAFIDSRPPLDRIFDATEAYYGCTTFLSGSEQAVHSQFDLSEFATAPIVRTKLLKELKAWINVLLKRRENVAILEHRGRDRIFP
eukprot:GILI01041683.1.p1 GENE.GILI01041683.1~~GILI01041683.1.p1  ORF type:complete len:140 (+),score=0.22 GILI01041683.1:3-422(+)